MGLSGLVLGGALQGIGAGLAQQGKEQAQARAAEVQQDAMMRREIALENLRASNTADRDKRLSGFKMDEQAHGARVDDWKGARQTERSTQSTIKIDDAKSVNDARLARLQSGLRMTEDQAKAARDLYNDVAKLNAEVGEERIRADGALVLYSKTGAILSVSKPGLFSDPNAKDTMSGFGGASPFQGPSATPPANRPPLTSFEK